MMAAAETREFPFSAEHFRLISERVYRFSGIRLPDAKREMVYARLARRLRSLGIASFDDYIQFLELEPAEWEHCTNALTTNVTSFYREEHHFEILAAHVEFQRVNLMDAAWPIEPGLDAIFCRNVMIYFDKPTQRRLVERYAALIKPEGLFFAGHAESLIDQGRHFRLRGQTVYEPVK